MNQLPCISNCLLRTKIGKVFHLSWFSLESISTKAFLIMSNECGTNYLLFKLQFVIEIQATYLHLLILLLFLIAPIL